MRADLFGFARNPPLHLVNIGLASVDAESCTRLIRGGSVMSDFITTGFHELGATAVSTGHISQRDVDWVFSAFETPVCTMMPYPVVSARGQRPE